MDVLTFVFKIYFLDNIRSFMIFLVVLYHRGLVYESSGIGAYFWIVDDPATNDLSGIINLIVWFFRKGFQRRSGLCWWGQDKGRSSSGTAGLGFGSRSR